MKMPVMLSWEAGNVLEEQYLGKEMNVLFTMASV